MNLESIKIFCDVAETKSFTQAAQNYFISQPAVTKQMKQLENYYNVTLFDRNERKLKLTKAGETFYPFAKELIGINEIAFQEIQNELNEQNHRLVIGASFTIGEYLLPQVISEFKKQNTNIQIELSIGNTPSVLEKLNLNEVDVALVEGVFQIEKYDVYKFAEDNLIAICSSQNKLLKQDSVELSDLLKEQFIVREKMSGMRKIIKNELERHNMTYAQSFMELGSIQTIKSAVEANLGISFLPKIAVERELALGVLGNINVTNLNLSRDFWIVQKDTEFRKQIVRQFNDFIKGKNFN